jgi:hypothetical protein
VEKQILAIAGRHMAIMNVFLALAVLMPGAAMSAMNYKIFRSCMFAALLGFIGYIVSIIMVLYVRVKIEKFSKMFHDMTVRRMEEAKKSYDKEMSEVWNDAIEIMRLKQEGQTPNNDIEEKKRQNEVKTSVTQSGYDRRLIIFQEGHPDDIKECQEKLLIPLKLRSNITTVIYAIVLVLFFWNSTEAFRKQGIKMILLDSKGGSVSSKIECIRELSNVSAKQEVERSMKGESFHGIQDNITTGVKECLSQVVDCESTSPTRSDSNPIDVKNYNRKN